MKTTYFNRFEINMPLELAEKGTHPGNCAKDVEELKNFPEIKSQLDSIPAQHIREELRECGAWDDDELQDDDANLSRILWIACGNILEEERNK